MFSCGPIGKNLKELSLEMLSARRAIVNWFVNTECCWIVIQYYILNLEFTHNKLKTSFEILGILEKVFVLGVPVTCETLYLLKINTLYIQISRIVDTKKNWIIIIATSYPVYQAFYKIHDNKITLYIIWEK